MKTLIAALLLISSSSLLANLPAGDFWYSGVDQDDNQCQIFVESRGEGEYRYSTGVTIDGRDMGYNSGEYIARPDNKDNTTELLLSLYDYKTIIKVEYNSDKTAPLSYSYVKYEEGEESHGLIVFKYPEQEAQFAHSKVVIAECKELELVEEVLK